MLKTEIFSCFNKKLEKYWKDTKLHYSGHFFQSYIWLKHWYYCVGINQNIKISIVVGFDNRKTCFILPLCIKKINNISVLTFLGGDQTDYNGFIYNQDFNLNNKYFSLKEILNKKEFPNFDVIHFINVVKSDVQQEFYRDYRTNLKPQYISNSINLPAKWDDFKSQVGRSLLSNTKRKINKLKKTGNLKLEIIDYNIISQSELKNIFLSLFKDKGKRLTNTGNKNIFLNQDLKKFYMDMPFKLSKFSKIHLSILTLDNAIIASHWGVVDRKTFYWILPAFSYDWLWFSPGRIIMFLLIEWSITNKYTKFDLTIGDEKYKEDWANRRENLFELIYINNFFGLIYYLKISLKKYVTRIFLNQLLLKFKSYRLKI